MMRDKDFFFIEEKIYTDPWKVEMSGASPGTLITREGYFERQ